MEVVGLQNESDSLTLSTFERLSDGCIALDSDWRYTFVNSAAGDVLRRNPADLISQHIWTEFPTPDDDPYRVAYEIAMAQQRPISVESYDQTRGRWYENRIYPTPDGLTVIFLDVSERKFAEEREAGRNDILEGVAAHRPLRESLAEIAHLHERLNRDSLCSILTLSADGLHVDHGAAPSLPVAFTSAVDGLEIGEGHGSCGTAAARRERVIVADIATHPFWDDYRDLALPHGLRACWSTPVLGSDGQLLGTFAVYYREPREPTKAELTSIDAMLSITAIAIEGDHLITRLRERDYFFDMSAEIYCIFDMVTQRIVQANQMFCSVTGYSASELRDCHYMDLIHPDDHASVIGDVTELTGPEGHYADKVYRFVRKDGGVRWLAWNALLGPDQLAFAAARDVTEQRAAAEALQYASLHDPLTGLPWRSLLDDSVAEMLECEPSVWVLVIGLDHFHSVNESMGHSIGDAVLRQTAERLQATAGESCPIARFASDKFAVVATGMDEAAATAFGDRLRAAIAEPIDNEDYRIVVVASVGISRAPDHGSHTHDLLRRAEAAMVTAKSHGGDSTVRFSTQQMRDVDERLQLGRRLRSAVDQGHLELHYQPQYRVSDCTLSGFEALLRWTDDEWGQVTPFRFIPVAEAIGLMPEIGQWVLNEACRQGRLWLDAGHRGFTIAVNVSAQELRRVGLVTRVEKALALHDLPASVITLELTESSLMENVERATLALTELTELGIEIALDDFGTGYSSLAYLKHFPIKKIKIDQSFVRGLPGDREDAAIVRAIVAMAHQLRMTVAAEGVETETQRRFLISTGCDELQGYHLGRPAPAAEAERFFQGG